MCHLTLPADDATAPKELCWTDGVIRSREPRCGRHATTDLTSGKRVHRSFRVPPSMAPVARCSSWSAHVVSRPRRGRDARGAAWLAREHVSSVSLTETPRASPGPLPVKGRGRPRGVRRHRGGRRARSLHGALDANCVYLAFSASGPRRRCGSASMASSRACEAARRRPQHRKADRHRHQPAGPDRPRAAPRARRDTAYSTSRSPRSLRVSIPTSRPTASRPRKRRSSVFLLHHRRRRGTRGARPRSRDLQAHAAGQPRSRSTPPKAHPGIPKYARAKSYNHDLYIITAAAMPFPRRHAHFRIVGIIAARARVALLVLIGTEGAPRTSKHEIATLCSA